MEEGAEEDFFDEDYVETEMEAQQTALTDTRCITIPEY